MEQFEPIYQDDAMELRILRTRFPPVLLLTCYIPAELRTIMHELDALEINVYYLLIDIRPLHQDARRFFYYLQLEYLPRTFFITDAQQHSVMRLQAYQQDSPVADFATFPTIETFLYYLDDMND